MPLAPAKRRMDADDSDVDEELSVPDSEYSSGPEESEPGTDDEIAAHKAVASRSTKTKKRKLRATSPTQFGATLASYLKDDAGPSSELPLSVNKQHERERRKEKSQLKTQRAKDLSRKEAEEKGRVRDVIGGWGGESERALRKVAQRGGGSVLLDLNSHPSHLGG
jgi:hypothetical protein